MFLFFQQEKGLERWCQTISKLRLHLNENITIPGLIFHNLYTNTNALDIFLSRKSFIPLFGNVVLSVFFHLPTQKKHKTTMEIDRKTGRLRKHTTVPPLLPPKKKAEGEERADDGRSNNQFRKICLFFFFFFFLCLFFFFFSLTLLPQKQRFEKWS